MTADLFAPHTCAQCGKHGATWKCEVQGPDTSWLCYRFWCDSGCHANWSTGQPPPNEKGAPR